MQRLSFPSQLLQLWLAPTGSWGNPRPRPAKAGAAAGSRTELWGTASPLGFLLRAGYPSSGASPPRPKALESPAPRTARPTGESTRQKAVTGSDEAGKPPRSSRGEAAQQPPTTRAYFGATADSLSRLRSQAAPFRTLCLRATGQHRALQKTPNYFERRAVKIERTSA